jgi:plasmid stabilization system protein ParE
LKVVFEPGARQDLLDAIDWYLHEAGTRQAERFEAEMFRCLELLVALPAIGTRARHNVRKVGLRRFPYSIVYRDEPELIRIIAVAHHRREPAYRTKRR